MSDALHYIAFDLPELLQLLQESDVRELELQENGMRIRVRRAAADEGGWEVVELSPPQEPHEPQMLDIAAPMVGTFYRAAEPDSPPLADEGSELEETTVVGIIESLNVLNPVQAGCKGTVSKVLATDGQPVQYGQLLFQVMPGG